MKIEFINPFINAAIEVLQAEGKVKTVQRGSLSMESSSRTSKEITILIGITGSVNGLVMYGMTEATALKIACEMAGEKIEKFDQIAQSAIAEFANMITGNASIGLETSGFPCTISPPTLIMGKNTQISTINVKRMVVPFITGIGVIEIDLALKEKESK